jgi:hypothetical protein
MPVAAIGAIRGPAKVFARRLTMVMTERIRPTLSVTSIGLAAAMLVAGWVATPASSAEPEERTRATSVTLAVESDTGTSSGGRTITVAGPVSAGTVAPVTTASLGAGGTCSADDPKRRRGQQDLEARIERLERHLEKIARQLEQSQGYTRWAAPGPKVPAWPDMPEKPEFPEMLSTPEALATVGFFAPGPDEGEVVRAYKVPKGRLKALAKLMVRADVPTRVSVLDDDIEVHGTVADHLVFKAFVDIITKEEETDRTYRLSEGKLKALTELMARDDVPVLISPREKGIAVRGSPAVQAIFKAFVDMIEPKHVGHEKCDHEHAGHEACDHAHAGAASEAYNRFLAESAANTGKNAKAKVRAAQRQITKAQAQYQAQAAQARQTAQACSARSIAESLKYRQYRLQMEKFLQAARTLEGKAEALEEKANRFEEKADHMRDEAQDARDRASEADTRRKTAELRAKAEALEEEAEELQDLADKFFERAEDFEREAEELEEKAEDLEEHIEELEEEAEHEDHDEDEDEEEEEEEEEEEDDEDFVGEV